VNARTAVAVPLVIAAAIALAACSGGGAATQPQQDPDPSTSSTSSTTSTPTPSVYDDATVQPAPAASEGAQDTAVTAAEKVVRTYAQPKLSAAAWAQQMTPLLSQSGAVAYEGQDPTTIPATKVTGSGKIVDGATDVALNVLVPTDAGEYNVALSRSGDSAPWLANEIRPVDGE
jgi:hypothetical protein